ncbi:hypothetical protein ACRTC9_02670 [Vibrio vulnificus]|uniref:hypothetical protein n=1 Tax=Vibrio vulnificus TaxID=672 RepID=UPI003D7EF30A
MKINLLIVEDDTAIISEWKQSIALYNIEEEEKKKFDINAEYVDNLVDSSELIKTKKFDAIVIDIRLKSNNQQPNSDGNIIINDAISDTMALIAVCTAEPNIVEIPSYQNELIEIFQKGVAGKSVVSQSIEWLEKKVKLISSVQHIRTGFDKEMATLFSRSIWARWNYWVQNTDTQEINRALTRHMATHLHASFMNEGNQKAHPEEYFFIPPLREQLDTGDIFKNKNGQLAILVTPRCELAQDKHDTFQLITLDDVSDDWTQKVEKISSAKDEGKRKNAQDSLRRFSNHSNNTASCHFIPEIRIDADTTLGPFFARFNKLTSIEKGDAEAVAKLKEERFASLSNEFVPSLVERLGNFFSRIGTPDYSHPE